MDAISREERAEWLKLARERAGFKSAKKAAAYCGLPQKTYHNFESGRSDPLKRVDFFAEKFGVPTEALLMGAFPGEEAQSEDTTPIAKLPEDSSLSELFSLFGCIGNAVILKNPDRAMTTPENAKILPSDILVFDSSLPGRAGDYVLAQIAGLGEPVFRVFSPLRGRRVALSALNPAVKPITLARANLEILGRLCFIARGAETLG